MYAADSGARDLDPHRAALPRREGDQPVAGVEGVARAGPRLDAHEVLPLERPDDPVREFARAAKGDRPARPGERAGHGAVIVKVQIDLARGEIDPGEGDV